MKRIIDYKDDDVHNNEAPTFRYLCTIKELPAGKSRQFSIRNDKRTKKIQIAVFNVDGTYYCISNKCQHQGGPLSKGILNEKKKVVTCPWHGWKYSIKDSKLQFTKETEKNTRILGISTTNSNDKVAPRKSTSEEALHYALAYAKNEFGAETKMIKLRDLHFKHCEGYYSKNASACIFPCSISEMDKEDQMVEIYQKVIIWADIVIISTPIRWGNASSLYYQMIQRMNCVQNQMITHDIYLIRDKIAAFIITGGQDNVQHVAGELMTFWSQLGFVFGKFPFVGWTRGWYAEDTENNLDKMKDNEHMQQDIIKTINGAVEMSRLVKENRYDERVLEQVHSRI